MGAVGMDQHARGVGAVMGVAADVVAPVRHHAFPAGGSEPLGDDEAGKARADDQKVGGGVGFQEMRESGVSPPRCRPWSTFREGKKPAGG